MTREEELQQRIETLEQQLAATERQRQMDYQRGELGKGMYLEIFRSNMNKYPGKRQEWYVRLRAANHEILNTSEGFVTKWNAKRHAKKVFPYLEVKYIDA